MIGPEGIGFALVTRDEVVFTVGQLSEAAQLAQIEDPATAELPIELVGDEAKVVAGAAKSYLLGLHVREWATNSDQVATARRILYSYSAVA